MRALSTFAFAVLLLFFACQSAAAQDSPTMLAVNETAAPARSTGATMVISGRVESPAGPLAGAVVSVDGKTYQKAVTNIDGEFHLTVPTTTEALAITASYAGFRDVSAAVQPGTALALLRLTEQQDIKLKRHLQLKAYLKGAHKEARRESRKLRRA